MVAAGLRPISQFPEETQWVMACVRPGQVVMCLCEPLAGIEPTGNMVKQPARFTVDTISAGQGDLMVFVEDPEGNKEEVCRRMLPPPSASQGACQGPGTVPPFSPLKFTTNTVFLPKGS